MILKPVANVIQQFHLSITSSTSSEPLAMSQIFPFCFVMYGGVAAMWLLYGLYNKGKSAQADSGNDDGVGLAYVSLLSGTWAACSVGMHVLNKSLADCLEAPCIISSIQMAIAVIYFGVTSYRQVMEANRGEMMLWLIVPVFFAAMLCSSFYTYQYISLSLLTVVRNLTPLMVLPMEGLVMPADKQPQITSTKIAALLVMLTGALVYSGGLKQVSMLGICFAFGNMFFAATDRLIQRRLLTTECKSLTSSVCAVVSNGAGIIPAMMLALATREVQGMAKPEHAVNWSDFRVMVLLTLSGIVGIGICYTGFELQRVISATSFAVMQNASKVAVVACGVVFFRDPIESVAAVAGLTLSLSGSYIYSQASLKPDTPKEEETAPARQPAPESNQSAV